MFSVAIPVYNHRRYLTGAVLSALSSALVKEVLLVDDGSRDGSPELIARLAAGNPRVRDLTIPGEGNRGAHVRLNQLVEAAAQPWVAVLNSDDFFAPGRFEALAQVIRRRRPEFVFGHLLLMDDSDRVTGTKRGPLQPEFPYPRGLDVRRLLAEERYDPLLANQNFIATTSNMVFTKDLHARVGGFADLRYAHDWDFALRASRLGRSLMVGQFLSLYRLHASNTIKENLDAIGREVRGLFDRFLADFPQARDEPDTALALAGNKYLADAAAVVD